MLYLQNYVTTSALDFLGANWSRICLSRALNHGTLWHIVFLRLRNILTYSLTYLLTIGLRSSQKRAFYDDKANDITIYFIQGNENFDLDSDFC